MEAPARSICAFKPAQQAKKTDPFSAARIASRPHRRPHDAGSYAPVTILIDERPDGTHISYDRMASFLESYGNEEALKVARDLDAKVEKLLVTAAK